MTKANFAVSAFISTAVAILPALAQMPSDAGRTDIGTVRATGEGTGSAAPTVPETATQFAPSGPSLDQSEPTSSVGAETLRKIIVPTENYNDVVRLTPSAMDIAPAGPGLQQDFNQSIRGLQYTQFSVLFDGIPIPGFPFNFAPQPGIYFVSPDLSNITVHRGPGSASVLAPNTFGGYVTMESIRLENKPSVMPYGTAGSYGTWVYGAQAQTGAIQELNGTRAMIGFENRDAGGADSGIATRTREGFLKIEMPVGENTLVTALANLNHTFTTTPYGATLANIQRFGPSYALNYDPTSQSFAGYNHDDYTTDFEYIGVKSELGDGITVDNKIYTTSYYQRSYRGADTGGQAPNLLGISYLNGVTPADLTGDVPGLFTKFFFRNSGDILRFSKDLPFGQLRWGVWAEHEGFNWREFQIDDTRGFVPITSSPGSIFMTNFNSTLNTFQPFVEFAWKPLPNVTVTPGLKYALVTRTVKGGAGLDRVAQDARQSYAEPLPSLDANWKITDWASVFAQAARGFETPSLNGFTTTLLTSINPSTTNSYQIGTVIQRPLYSFGVDLYYIQYDNYVNSQTVGGVTTFFNQGGANYKGVEVEGTVKVLPPIALYANGSLNSSAYTANGNVLQQTPRRTAALGIILDKGDVFRDGDEVFGSLIGKIVGPQYGADTSAPGQPDTVPIKTFSLVTASGGYNFDYNGRKLSLKVNLYNLFDSRSIIGYAGQTNGPPSEALYWTNPGRSVFVTLSAKI